MKAIIISTIIAAWIALTWILAKAAGMASREEEERWGECEQDNENDT